MYKIIVMGILGISLCANTMAETRFIIKYKPTSTQSGMLALGNKSAKTALLQMMQPLSNKVLTNLSTSTNAQVTDLHAIATGAHVISVDKDLDTSAVEKFINQVKQDDNVLYIEEDRILKPTDAAPMDTNPDWQWDMSNAGSFDAEPHWTGDNIVASWILLAHRGYYPGNNITVAVVDTGYTPHPNFINNLQSLNGSSAYGYSFMSDCRMSGTCSPSTPSYIANRSLYAPDAKDLGDYVSVSDIDNSGGFFNSSCYRRNSSWHGSHVTGTIVSKAYESSNTNYITGGAYGAKVLPVKVLGKCGGYTSDILNGMLWASGFDVVNNDGSAILDNPNPAQVINLSLGGAGDCSQSQQDAINTMTNNGIVIVAAAGNGHTNVFRNNPANCANVISVAAKGPTNALASYSNYGDTTITASGGDITVSSCLSNLFACPSSIYSTIWSSPYQYESESEGGYPVFATYEGTSMATPHVVATVANMLSVLRAINESYTTYGIAQVLKQTAQPYNNCNSSGCTSTGSLDAEAAVNYILENRSVPAAPAPLVSTGGGSGGGGGCSAIKSGDDYSLILLLFSSGVYAYRRKKLKNKKTLTWKG